MFEAFVKTKEAVQDYEDNGIPRNHIMAYVGLKITPEVREVIDVLHERGVMCMISTALPTINYPHPKVVLKHTV